jgi:hypothetical protein
VLVSRMISCAHLLPGSAEDFSLDCIRQAMAIISRIVATFQIAHFSRVCAAYGGVFVAMPPAVQPASSAPASNSRSHYSRSPCGIRSSRMRSPIFSCVRLGIGRITACRSAASGAAQSVTLRDRHAPLIGCIGLLGAHILRDNDRALLENNRPVRVRAPSERPRAWCKKVGFILPVEVLGRGHWW